MDERSLGWEPPGPGFWQLEVSHYGGRMTPFYREIYGPAFTEGTARAAERYGVPGKHGVLAFVNDRPYTRFVPLTESPSSGRLPPAPLIWLAARLHPGLRRRTRAAARAFEGELWREDLRRWTEEQKPQAVAANLELQREPIGSYDDAALADHVTRAAANLGGLVRLHFELIGPGVMMGDFLVAARGWGIPVAEAVELLAGGSPASAETVRWLEPVANPVRATGAEPRSLEDLRALEPAAVQALDAYLERFGHWTVSRFDVDGLTLAELPNLVVDSVLAIARRASAGPGEARAERSREQVPAADRPRFDEFLDAARAVYGSRDDNAGITLQWPAGLLRRALLEAGRRLTAAGCLEEPEHTFELRPPELTELLAGGGAGPDEVAARAATRRANEAVRAPLTLGPEEPDPPVDLLPEPLARTARASLIALELLEGEPERPPLTGVGIGTEVVRGRARVARSPDDALAKLADGDILVAPYTTPAYNAVLPMLSALVVEEGGALSHAAIVAREFGISAVIGARGAVHDIPDGAEVEVDPGAGAVRLV